MYMASGQNASGPIGRNVYPAIAMHVYGTKNLTHGALRLQPVTSTHGLWYDPLRRIFTLLPNRKHGQNMAVQHTSHPPPPRHASPSADVHSAVSNPSWVETLRSLPSRTLPFLSVAWVWKVAMLKSLARLPGSTTTFF